MLRQLDHINLIHFDVALSKNYHYHYFIECFLFFRAGQHLKKSSLSESSSDMMDLEEGVESTPGVLGESQIRLPPFLGSVTDRQQVNCCKSPSNGQNLQQRHNSALAVSIETDV